MNILPYSRIDGQKVLSIGDDVEDIDNDQDYKPSMSTENSSDKAKTIDQKILKKLAMPQWAILLIVFAALLIFCICCACCVQRACKSKNPFKSKKDKNKVKHKDPKKPPSTKHNVQPKPSDVPANMPGDEEPVSEEENKNLGKIEYTIDYDFRKQELKVGVIQAQELPPMDTTGASDPYVKIYLLPDKKDKFRTEHKRKTLNPIFDETFTFKNLTYGELGGKTLVLAVYDYDRFSRHDPIGEVRVPLITVDFGQVTRDTKELVPPPNDREFERKLGEICFTLRYIPTTNKLTVTILEAKDLKKMDVGGLSDPYVKISIIQNGKRIKKKKTSIKKSTLNPYFNESFTFDVPYVEINRVQLLIVVVDYDRLGTSEPIGQVRLGTNVGGKDPAAHWAEMIASPRRPIARWHVLKPAEEGKTA